MAAATMSSAIDLKSQTTFPIRLGNSISKSSSSTRFTSVRYNHKPKLNASDSVKATIKQGESEGESKLLLQDDGGKYKYEGRHVQDEESYVLVIRGKEMTLERMGSSHGFNLTSTPEQSDSGKLADKYPHLPEGEGEDGDLFGDEAEDAPPDESNPFDYRHFLKAELDKQKAAEQELEARRSTAGTPLVRHQVTSSATPLTKTTKAPKKADTKVQPPKRKAPAKDKANNPKRVKAGQEPSAPSEPAAKPKAKPDVPRISLDRKASLRRPSLDDSGELILENETPVTEKPRSAMAMALSGQLGAGAGPISLRSAANSPGSHVASPAPERPDHVDEEYVFEFDDDPEPSKPSDHGVPEDEEDADEEDDEDDADVDDFELPSPAQAHRPSVSAPAPASAPVASGDDDDDLDKQLALAFEEDDGGNQESEESEEE